MSKKKEKEEQYRRCTQTQCSYYLSGGCRACENESCRSKPYIINTSCVKCINCEGVPGELRFSDPEKEKEMKSANKEAETEVLKALIRAFERRIDDIEKGKAPPQKVPVIIQGGL